ncbi:MAG: hypothetical protein PHH31_04730 [Acidaminococcaceae bacterium]|nr:hypothetical protein [Acidaminococcaceae bacterium]MDD4722546.1 hypothetical protein [Acidaminococcaceae bacterium]
MLAKNTQRLIAAFILVGFMGFTSLAVTAEASPRHHDHRQERRIDHHRHEDRESHSDTGNLVTGLIIGGVVGAVVANNT